MNEWKLRLSQQFTILSFEDYFEWEMTTKSFSILCQILFWLVHYFYAHNKRKESKKLCTKELSKVRVDTKIYDMTEEEKKEMK